MITIYYKPECPYCQNAINLCKRNKVKYELHNVFTYGGKSNVISSLFLNNYLKSKSDTTVPIIFNNGKYIGGSAELIKLFN